MFQRKKCIWVSRVLASILLISSINCGAATMALTLTSPQFVNEKSIPSRYTCDAENVSIPLNWENAPKNTKSLVLIMDDPDSSNGTWDHWLIFNIPPTIHSLNENLQNLPAGAKAGRNSDGKNIYGGPCPPDGEHRYFFKLYALDTIIDLPEGSTKAEIENAIQSHILEQAQLIGKYKRTGHM